ncbi:hypothetical protein PTSG_07451 [Salpingoeca rosetta]|uniref:Uncharacterized protein n=1 Tax=Salpingoeca rosetta (strain ATCC 50818 / BSB-021) TaxID=946362 RepID=F2UIR8_SALR5|nr:uncharacterized protein PTSG_07451 [Salpingoeca rosetta]EGD77117.1 hypothetical protein PTSG_07451 [Salpingoeca rosetta]|eukprot:XP_004990956.1 hypothetical protein PTSG_07451 [Salpingoeca rosetta]
MKIELKKSGQHNRHKDVAAAVVWTTSGSLVSAGDDHRVLQWNETLDDASELINLKEEWYPTSVAVGPNPKRSQGDVFAIAFDDGKFRLMAQTGRIEKTVEAHTGAITTLRWSADGQSILTAGEDGLMKVWSRAGMLRTVLAQSAQPVYGAAWSPCGSRAIHTAGKHVAVVSLKATAKAETWKAHDGVVLCVDWGAASNLIVSGGEDGRYKVWDAFGRLLYASTPDLYPITSCRWSPTGDAFAVGGYNSVRLCDRAGWSYAVDKPATGSVYEVQWSHDGTRLAGACASGDVLLGQLVMRSVSSPRYVVTQTGPATLIARSIAANTDEELDFREPIVKMVLRFGHLVVTTATQCVVYAEDNWLSPSTIMLKAPAVAVTLGRSHIALADKTDTITVYTYDGKTASTIKPPHAQSDRFSATSIAVADDTVAIIDHRDAKAVRVYDTQSGKEMGKPLVHSVEISTILLDQGGASLDRCLAFVDKNRDLCIVQVRRSQRRAEKIATMVSDAMWHDDHHMLATLQEAKLQLWFYPACAFVDQDMLSFTKQGVVTGGDLGKAPYLTSFSGNTCSVRRADGASMTFSVPPQVAVLQSHTSRNAWEDAIRLCRFIKEDALWACLAVIATKAKELNAAEIAYAAVNAIDKVEFLQLVKSIPTAEGRKAELAVFSGQIEEAATTLLQAGLIYRLVDMYIRLFDWDKALDVAIKHKTHVDTVLASRQRYLEGLGQRESKAKFVQYSQSVEVDWDDIQLKIQQALEAEKQRPGATPYV